MREGGSESTGWLKSLPKVREVIEGGRFTSCRLNVSKKVTVCALVGIECWPFTITFTGETFVSWYPAGILLIE
jgi:hypothetical protein